MNQTQEDVFALALSRMYQWQQLLSSLSQQAIPVVTWPSSETSAVTAKQQLVADATGQRMQQAQSNQQDSVRQQFLAIASNPQTHQQSNLYQSAVQGGYSVQTQNEHPTAQSIAYQQWSSIAPSSQVSNHLTNVEQSKSPASQTTVHVSPTIEIQATVYEQADLDALVTKLNRLLEQELAVSAERAYT